LSYGPKVREDKNKFNRTAGFILEIASCISLFVTITSSRSGSCNPSRKKRTKERTNHSVRPFNEFNLVLINIRCVCWLVGFSAWEVDSVIWPLVITTLQLSIMAWYFGFFAWQVPVDWWLRDITRLIYGASQWTNTGGHPWQRLLIRAGINHMVEINRAGRHQSVF